MGSVSAIAPELPQPIFFSDAAAHLTAVGEPESFFEPQEAMSIDIEWVALHSSGLAIPDVSKTDQSLTLYASESPFNASFAPTGKVEEGLSDSLTGPSKHSEADAHADAQIIVVAPSQPQKFSKSELRYIAARVAEANNLPVSFFVSLIQQESGFRPDVVSSAGAQGIAQFMPEVAAAKGLVNPFDPIESLSASGKLLAQLVDRFGNLGLAAAAYNAGSQRVRDWMSKRRQLPAETRHYVRIITGIAAEAWARKIMKTADVRLQAHPRYPDGTMRIGASELARPAPQTGMSSIKRQERVSSFAQVRQGAATTNKVPGVGRSMPRSTQSMTPLSANRFATKGAPDVGGERKSRAQLNNAPVKLTHKAAVIQQSSGGAKLHLDPKRNTAPPHTKTASNFMLPSPPIE